MTSIVPPPIVPDSIVPVVDIGGWESGDETTRHRITTAIGQACRTVGFMQIVGHGIDGEVEALTRAIDWFFGLDPDDKATSIAPRPSINRGYTPPRSERLSYSLGVASPDDLFEAFNVGASASDFAHLDLDEEVYAENIWPTLDGGDAFRADVSTWFDAARGVADRMTEIFAATLGLEPNHFDEFTDHSIDVLRMNHYHVPDGITLEPSQLGMGAHTDYGIVTVLWADPVAGLEILRPDGSWLSVVPEPGALLINLGDLTSRWTNDQWMSTMHRVVPPTDAEGRLIRRRSAAYFHDGNADAIISTLPPCRNADGTSSYDDVTVSEHIGQKLAGSRGLELNQHAEREAARVGAALD
ncbi:MAG: isopenicillin N synthase family dioxygenase [Ilumatobacter sp.]|jgi:isopenicillin N synthase-like dioxygenase|uniref:isopenicillin N synthase family dioxygenase n=1 Tax=Ilumatobacter sp. TaxID=1967498 RepID=UPI00391CEC17